MAITSEDIQQQSFKIERRGYDVDEVDVFLEHVSDEIDALNDEIAHLRAQLAEAKSAPASANQQQQAAPSSEDSAALAEKDARIAELESQLGERKSEDNAIAQALIIAQRTADEIVSKAKTDGENIRRNAEEEGQRILDKADGEKQRIIEQISELTVSREKVREQTVIQARCSRTSLLLLRSVFPRSAAITRPISLFLKAWSMKMRRLNLLQRNGLLLLQLQPTPRPRSIPLLLARHLRSPRSLRRIFPVTAMRMIHLR